VLDTLLDAGANPNIRDNLGGCALQEAVKAGQKEMVEVRWCLLVWGSEPVRGRWFTAHSRGVRLGDTSTAFCTSRCPRSNPPAHT